MSIQFLSNRLLKAFQTDFSSLQVSMWQAQIRWLQKQGSPWVLRSYCKSKTVMKIGDTGQKDCCIGLSVRFAMVLFNNVNFKNQVGICFRFNTVLVWSWWSIRVSLKDLRDVVILFPVIQCVHCGIFKNSFAQDRTRGFLFSFLSS